MSLSNRKIELARVTHALERVGRESRTGQDTEKKGSQQGGFGTGQDTKEKQVGDGDPLTGDGRGQDRSGDRKKASERGTHLLKGANLETGQDTEKASKEHMCLVGQRQNWLDEGKQASEALTCWRG